MEKARVLSKCSSYYRSPKDPATVTVCSSTQVGRLLTWEADFFSNLQKVTIVRLPVLTETERKILTGIEKLIFLLDRKNC